MCIDRCVHHLCICAQTYAWEVSTDMCIGMLGHLAFGVTRCRWDWSKVEFAEELCVGRSPTNEYKDMSKH